MIGSVVEACTSATRSADALIEAISQAAPTDWIRPPKLEASSQSIRRERCGAGKAIAAMAEVPLYQSLHPVLASASQAQRFPA